LLKASGRALLLTVATLLGLGGAAACASPKDPAQSVCDSFRSAVYGGTNPTNQSSFLTTSSVEAAALTRQGYTYKELLGPSFLASETPGEGLVEVHRLYRKQNRDYLWSAEPREIAGEVRDHGYDDQGIAFYLSPAPSDCLVGVHRYVFRGQHRLVVTDEDKRLKRAGWKDEGVKFYAAPSTFTEVSAGPSSGSNSSQFTIAVMPDTQLEVIRAKDTRLRDRSVWLVENQKRLNLAFVVHTGDVVDGDSPRHEQYERAKKGIEPLQAAGVPYTLAVGNRDTAATCSEELGNGGESQEVVKQCTDQAARRQVRDTSVFNRYFKSEDFTHLEGQFEKGKVDNEYATYEAGGLQWLVLTLELWPRPEAVRWANEVVEAHPKANVIVATHSYLTASGDIMQTNGGYGATSPQYLFDNLISRHENIRFVLSGHTGGSAHRVDKGVNGNTIYSFLQAIHDPKHDPTRMIQVDTKAKTVHSWIYNSDLDRISPGTEVSHDGLDLTR
jgi:hypothetical protein